MKKGQEFIRTCKAMGCVALLLDGRKNFATPTGRFDCIDEVFTMPEDLPLQSLIYAVSLRSEIPFHRSHCRAR